MLKVCKFGGSSLSDEVQFNKVKDIIESDPDRKVVVVSAPGRRFKEDTKITDLLYLSLAHLKYDVPFDNIKEMISDRYLRIAAGCHINIDVSNELDEIFSKLNKRTSEDFLASRGEYLNAKLMASHLGYKFIDAIDWMTFKYDGEVDYEESERKLSELYKVYGNIVTPGFYGAMPNGDIKVFSRGGSDITGAIAAACLDADMYENWTDVSGILMVDPRIVKNPNSIEKLTYAELREMSYMGASVLHEDTVFPVRQKDIPVNIRNTNDPDNPGTIIRESFKDDAEDQKFITGITGVKNFDVINIYKSNMESKASLLLKVLKVCEQYDIYVENIPSGVDCFSLVVPQSSLDGKRYEFISALKEVLGTGTVSVTEGISLLAIVGRQMAYKEGISGRIFTTLGANHVNIRTIEQSSDEICILVGVETADFETAIRVLYESFAI